MELFEQLNNFGKGSLFEYGLITTLLLMVAFMLMAAIVNRVLTKSVTKVIKENAGITKRMIKYIVYILAIYGCLSMIVPLKSILGTMWGSAGILAVVVGFASQEAMSNFVNGILITTFKPFKEGDLVRIDDGKYQGTVIDISLRDTVVLTSENTKVIIPNSTMNKVVLENINQESGYKANFLLLEVGYDSDLDVVKKIVFDECMKHPKIRDYRSEEDIAEGKEAVEVLVFSFNESGITIRAKVYSYDYSSGVQMTSDLREAIKKRFDAEGIEFPYPHRVVINK
jgi:small-conductance mechanosensitive channel